MNVTIKELHKQEEPRNRAVIYARYSSDKQKEASIEQQIKECMEYITRKGYTLVSVYSDSAKSASKNVEKRSDFLKLIEESRYGEFDVVVSYALDRISREAHGGFYGYENALNQNGVRIEYATQVFDDGYGGEISKAVHVTMASEYVAQLRKNVVRGMCDNAMKGNYNGGPCVPIGIKIIDGGKNNKRYALDEATAPFVRQVFEQYVMGKSTGEIADFLNNNGIRNNRGGKITHETVNKMIENPLYKGTKISVFDNKAAQKVYTVEGICEPIVSEDLWEQAQVVRGKRKYRGARADARVEYILRGKLFCGICGDDMIAYSGKSRNGEMHYYYACRSNRNNTGEARCKKKSVNKTVIENAVMDIITDWIWDEDKIKEIIAAAREADAKRVIDPRIAQIQASIKKHKERKQRASEKYLESGDEVWADHVREENDLLQADEKELAAIKRQEADPKTADEFISEIEDLRKCWSVMRSSNDGRKMIICNYVERIDVYNESPDEPGWIKLILTIRTDPVGKYSKEVTAMIPVAVSGWPPMVHHPYSVFCVSTKGAVFLRWDPLPRSARWAVSRVFLCRRKISRPTRSNAIK